MARRKVIAVEMMKYERATPKTEYLGWGPIAVRKLTTIATSPRLIAYRSCIAREMKAFKAEAEKAGRKLTLKDIQLKFKEIAPKCASEAAKKA